MAYVIPLFFCLENEVISPVTNPTISVSCQGWLVVLAPDIPQCDTQGRWRKFTTLNFSRFLTIRTNDSGILCFLTRPPNTKEINLHKSYQDLLLRSAKETGLHERAFKAGRALLCEISFKAIPVKKNVDDPALEMVDWPFLLPHHFDTWIEFSNVLVLPFWLLTLCPPNSKIRVTPLHPTKRS